MNALFDWWLTFVGAGSVILFATWTILWLGRRASSSTRELIARSGLCAAAFAPFVAILLPAEFAAQLDAGQILAPILPTSTAVRIAADSPAATPTPDLHEPSAVAIGSHAIVSVWIVGGILLLVRVALALIAAHRVARALPRPDAADWREDLDAARSAYSMHSAIDVRLRSDETPAYVIGGRRPIVVLPRSAREWSKAHRAAVLAHELAHVERGDPLWVPLVRCAVAVRWFDPLAWWLEREANAQREHACDDRAILAGTRPSTLASALWAAYSAARSTPAPAPIPGIARSATLRARIESCLATKPKRGGLPRVARLATQWAMFVVCAALATRVPAAAVFDGLSSAPRIQARWTDGSVTVGAFLRGEIDLPVRLDAPIGLSRNARLVVFAFERDASSLRTWIATPDPDGKASWRAFVDGSEVTAPLRSDATWRAIHDETARRLASVSGSGPPIAVRSTRTSGSTLIGSPACSIDPGAAVVQRTVDDDGARLGVFAQRDAWAGFVVDGDDGSEWIGVGGHGRAALTLVGHELSDPAALAARCLRTASDAFSRDR